MNTRAQEESREGQCGIPTGAPPRADGDTGSRSSSRTHPRDPGLPGNLVGGNQLRSIQPVSICGAPSARRSVCRRLAPAGPREWTGGHRAHPFQYMPLGWLFPWKSPQQVNPPPMEGTRARARGGLHSTWNKVLRPSAHLTALRTHWR